MLGIQWQKRQSNPYSSGSNLVIAVALHQEGSALLEHVTQRLSGISVLGSCPYCTDKALDGVVSRLSSDTSSNQEFCDSELLRSQWDFFLHLLVISDKYTDTNPKRQHLLLLPFFSESRLTHVRRQVLVPSDTSFSLRFGGTNALK